MWIGGEPCLPPDDSPEETSRIRSALIETGLTVREGYLL